MRFLSSLRVGLSTSSELIRSLWRGPYWWLVPVVMGLLMMSILFVFLQAVPWAAPFVYTIF